MAGWNTKEVLGLVCARGVTVCVSEKGMNCKVCVFPVRVEQACPRPL